jgi:hypothetical protein
VSPNDLLQLVTSDDPTVSLDALRQLRELLMTHERRSVLAARRQGMSWEQIAALLGRARQGLWERHRDLED